MKRELPRGIRIDHGYVQVRIFPKGHRPYFKNFGLESAFSIEMAKIHLAEKRKEVLMGTFGIVRAQESTFAEVAAIYDRVWSAERRPDGSLAHSVGSIYNTRRMLYESLVPYFGKTLFNLIKPKDVKAWRESRMKDGLLGTSVNREQAVLSSLFTLIMARVKNEEMPAIRLPDGNPCETVEKAETRKRERIVTEYEISKLKNAARVLGDEIGRKNIELAVMTCLSKNDLITLRFGDVVNLRRSKSGTPVLIPITVDYTPDWTNWRKRWEEIRRVACLEDIEWRDLRKAGGNMLLGDYDIKLVSQYMGHSEQKTTETIYMKLQADKMRPLAEALKKKVEAL